MNKRKLIILIVVALIGLIIGLASLINAFFSFGSSNFEMMVLWLIIGIISLTVTIVCAYFGDFLDALRLPP